MPMTSEAFLLLTGAVIVVGILGDKLFHITFIPSTLILMLGGLLVGPPILAIVDVSYDTLFTLATWIGSMALVLIMFEAGADLNLRKLRDSLKPAVAIGVSAFLSAFYWPLG